MNVDSIYQLQRDDAFAAQFSAEEYETFVAMPFSNRGGYPEPRIKKLLLEKVHKRANSLLAAPKGKTTFAPLHRVDGGSSGGAVVITDKIVTDILNSHFFVGDLTGGNFWVVLEAGIALALKPNDRVLLFTQDDTALLHFDLKVTNVNRYSENSLVEKVARVLVGAARDFEREADRYIRLLSSQLTPDGISALNIYGRLWKDRKRKTDRPSLWESLAASYSPRFTDNLGSIAFHQAVRELSGRRLLWTDYKPNVGKGKDAYGVHATKLGWRVIEHLWSHDPQMREPGNAPIGPNLG
jgi:hypothetical protein